MTAYTLVSAYLILLALAATTARAGDPPTGGVIAQLITATRNCETQMGWPRSKSGNPWKPHSRAYRAWQKNLWTNRLNNCRKALHRRAFEWNWQAWLPDKWRRIAICETGLNWQHRNSSYEGAFGFAVGSWDAFKNPGYPDSAADASPWQQYQVALNIYRRYGLSGWGCRNA